MNRNLVSKAISNIDDAFIAETLSPPVPHQDRAPERTIQMGRYESKKNNVRSRRLVAIALAACLVFAMAATAYAANLFGIRDILTDFPEAADPYIQVHTETMAAEDWSARMTESFCDVDKIITTVTVSGGDKYIIAPTDADPDTHAVNIGIEGDMTLCEYAAQQGKELLFVGATLVQNEQLGIFMESQTFVNVSASEMNILVESNRIGDEGGEAICNVYARDAAENRMNLELPFTLKQAPSDSSGTYVPHNVNPFPGMTVGNVTVSESPLGISIRFMTSVESQEVFDDIKKVEFDGIVRGEGGGWVLEDDGNWWFTVSGCTGDVGDTLIARYYDWDDQPIGTITFVKQ